MGESAALGRVFGRPGLMAAVGPEAARISLAILRHKQLSDDLPELLARLQPAATACLRCDVFAPVVPVPAMSPAASAAI